MEDTILKQQSNINSYSNAKRDNMVKVIFTIVFILIGISMMLPFFWMISASFKKPIDIFQYPLKWIPEYWYPDNYIYIFSKQSSIWIMYLNSIKITLICTVGAAITSSLAAYAFAKMKFKGRDVLFLLYISTLIIPHQVTYIPRFALFSWLHLVNTHYALILPGLYAVFGVFLLRQYFMQVPDELIESAVVDGAGELKIWWKIMMPLAKPALASFGIIVFTHHWNDYETPLIFIRSKNLSTIPLGLVNFTDESGKMYHYIMALTTLAILPLFVIFLAGQKYFIKGLTAGAVKG